MVSYFFEKISKNHLQKNKNCIQYIKQKMSKNKRRCKKERKYINENTNVDMGISTKGSWRDS